MRNVSYLRPRASEAGPITLNIFAGAYAKEPSAEDDFETWSEVAAELEALAELEASRKTELLGFNFATLAEPYNVNVNVSDHTALAIDVDECDLDVIASALEGTAAIVLASPSDPNPDGSRRVRICAPVSRPIQPGEVKHVRRAFAESIGIGPGQGVEGAEAVSQIFFAGRIEGSPDREVRHFDGPPIDVDALASAPLLETWKASTASAASTNTGAALERFEADPDERTEALIEALHDHWEPPGEAPTRRATLRALGGYLARRGWEDAQIAAVVCSLPMARSEAARIDLAIEAARQARKDPENTAGWSTLIAWSPDAAALIEGTAKDPREPQGFTGVWSEWWARAYAPGGWVSRMRERSARRAANDTAPVFAPPEDPDLAPLVLTARRDGEHILLWSGEHCGHQPVARSNLRLRIRELGLFDPGELKAQEIIEKHGATFSESIYDFAHSASHYDRERDRVVVGYPEPPCHHPRKDADVDAWLRALAGDDYPRVATWIASCSQQNIDRLAAALVLIGPADTGKTLFATACAKMWGAGSPPKAALLTSRFNGELTRCPIVFDDEAELFGSKDLSTKRFREVIQATERSIEKKGRETFLLRGALRLIVAGNDLSDLRFRDVTGPDVVDAVSDRLCIVSVADRADACRTALARLRQRDRYRVDLDRIVGHMMWLAECTEIPHERFIAGGGDAGGAVLAGHVDAHAKLFESLQAWIDEGGGFEWTVHMVGGEPRLCANPAKLVEALAFGPSAERWDLTRVREALSPFQARDHPHYRPRGQKPRPRLWVLDADALAGALSLDAESADRLADRLSEATTPHRPHREATGKFRSSGR